MINRFTSIAHDNDDCFIYYRDICTILQFLYISQAIAKFESMVNQIQKNARDIKQRLHVIEHANLFKSPKPKFPGHLPDCKVGKHV